MAGPAGGKELYTLLGVSRDCDAATLRAAWRARALENHPDKGGDEATFKQVQEAYEILSDPHRRSLYDAHGHAGLEGGFGGFGNMFGGFGGGGFGGGFAGRGGRRKPRKGKHITHALKLSLEQLFGGTRAQLAVHRDVICTTCSGSGSCVSPAPEPEDCPGCGGTGSRMEMKSLGRGMQRQVPVHCVQCGGSGTSIPEPQRCGSCRGQRVTKQRSEVEVQVEAGTRHKTKVVVAAMGDEVADTNGRPGDLVVTVHQLDHDIFVRKGDDLVLQQKITLREALCGCQLEIEHLDGRRLSWKSAQGQVIEHGWVQCIEGEGFPQTVPKHPPGQPSQPRARQGKGRLLIRFEVEFPSTTLLTDPMSGIQAALEAALPRVVEGDHVIPFGVDTSDVDQNRKRDRGNGTRGGCSELGTLCVLEEAGIAFDDIDNTEADSTAERDPDGQQCNQQ